MKNSITNIWFKYLTSHFLIYNTCWEDPEIDRILINSDSTSDILMITSAGDNAFDYLLDSPNSVHCVDINPYQTALFDLKCALFRHGNHEYLERLFLTGKNEYYQTIFESVEPLLEENTYKYWKFQKEWFSPKKGFYSHGLTGNFARFLNFLIDLKGLRVSIDKIIREESTTVRKDIFLNTIEPVLWKGLSKHFWKSDLVLGFAGIPETQSSGMVDLNEYMRETLYNIFVNQGVNKNYFWRLYLDGYYSKNCCPNYLKKEHFGSIRSQLSKLSRSTGTLTDFLDFTDKKYSHFILLDHQDWLIGNGTDELDKEWISILRSAKPKAKILMRSVHQNLDFLPTFVKSKIKSLPVSKEFLSKNDRVGTYPSTFLLEIDV